MPEAVATQEDADRLNALFERYLTAIFDSLRHEGEADGSVNLRVMVEAMACVLAKTMTFQTNEEVMAELAVFARSLRIHLEFYRALQSVQEPDGVVH